MRDTAAQLDIYPGRVLFSTVVRRLGSSSRELVGSWVVRALNRVSLQTVEEGVRALLLTNTVLENLATQARKPRTTLDTAPPQVVEDVLDVDEMIEAIQRVDVEDVGDLEADMAGLGIRNDDFRPRSGAHKAIQTPTMRTHRNTVPSEDPPRAPTCVYSEAI
jgi:hypothetical protein